ncbi:ABC transporter permease [Mesorhizobium sp. PAMC28654]|uniref:ABC transporter permease n=1 Tax=Mesorhizobium sp. PAMC28654 TaxID=2880934 RepID=UPI001D09DF7E|nr:ABC transporter permease [Mesorhizobium sp. PAMC28654]UDL89519.1 ABC transporter permease [Mesorhizobium sp. PAMC28654]
MSAIVAFLLGNPAILALGAAIVGGLGFGFQQRLAGAKAERVRQATAEAATRDIADQVQNDIGALPADAAREELRSWTRD